LMPPIASQKPKADLSLLNMASEIYEPNKIAEFKYWEAYIHEDQTYLGRCVVWYKEDKPLDIFELAREEVEEYWVVIKKIRDALKKSFNPDMFNYATLQNVVRHIHTHLIPRYSKSIEFAGSIFEDKKWGHNYTPYEKISYSEDVLQNIKKEIISNLQ